MKLKKISLKNFRCYTNEIIEFDTYTALVGANNSGKSAVLAAIDIFFRSNPKNIPITIDDFYKKRFDGRELEIELTFTDLSSEAIKEFDHYVRSGELTFVIRSQSDGIGIRSSIHGIRLANPEFAPFFEKKSAAEKKDFYTKLDSRFQLPKWSNQEQAGSALREYENKNIKENIPLLSEDNALGVEGPIPRLRQFIDFVFIPAVKDAGDEATEARNTAFTRLVERAVRAKLKVDEKIEAIRETARSEIDTIANEHQSFLTTLADKIDRENQKLNSTELKLTLEWGKLDEKNLQITLPPVHLQVADDLIKNSISKFGHGIQRSYLMALLMVSASYDFSELQTVIIACEEPELYQHPPQARLLAQAFNSLASNQAQIIVTTHSPYFINARTFENLRVIRRTRGEKSKCYRWSIDENCGRIARAKREDPIGTKAARAAVNQFLQPQMNEMFFSPIIIFVEGEEDRALIGKYIEVSNRGHELLKMGAQFVPVNGKGNLINAIAIAQGFQIPFFAIFDGDMNQNKEENIQLNKDILALLEYSGKENNGVIENNLFGKNFAIWKDCIQTAIQSEYGEWNNTKIKICEEFGWNIERLRKNAMVVEATLERVIKETKTIAIFEKLCEQLLPKISVIKAENN